MRFFTLSDLNRRAGEIADHAFAEPVVLTKHGRNQLVMLSVAQFEKMTGSALAMSEGQEKEVAKPNKRPLLSDLRKVQHESPDDWDRY